MWVAADESTVEEITVFFRLWDALDCKMHLGFRGGK